MAEKALKNDTRFKPGVSGNPGGRSASDKELRGAIQKRGMAYLREVEKIAFDPKTEASVRIRAFVALWDRGYGKPPESIKIAGGVTVEERKRVILESRGTSAN